MSEERKRRRVDAPEHTDAPEPVGARKPSESMKPTESPKYMAEALLLANSYTKMLEERARLEKLLAGSWVYTKDMAIDELDNITVSYEGERVQTSNISNPTERIALKLTDEFMAKKQAEMDAERNAVASELEYLNWKIGVVETVWHERMKGTQKSVFQLLYYQHKTFKEIGKIMLKKKKEKLWNRDISVIKKQIMDLFCAELILREMCNEENEYIDLLCREAQQSV